MNQGRKTERTYTLAGATLLGLGAIVGGGILAMAGVAFEVAGPSALIAFVFNGVIAVLTALSFAEMATTFPVNGGAYRFTKKILSVRASFGMGWILFFASLAAAALYAIGFAAYALEALRVLLSYAGIHVSGISDPTTKLMVGSGAVTMYAIVLTRSKGGRGTIETAGKLVLFGLILAGGFWSLGTSDGEKIAEAIDPFFPYGPYAVITAMGYTFITMQGFDLVASVGGEVQNPRRNLPRAMIYSLVVTQLIYLPLLFFMMTLGVPEGTGISELSSRHRDVIVAVAVEHFLGPAGYWLVILAALLSMLSALYVNMLAASRIVQSMAQDRTLPAYFDRTSSKTGTPVRAIVGVSCLLVALMLLLPDLQLAGAAASLIFLISFTLTHGLSILMRVREFSSNEAFRTPWFPLVPGIGGGVCLALAVFQGVVEPVAGGIVLVWISTGFIYFSVQLSLRAHVIDAREEVMDSSLIKYRGRSPLVLVPVSNPYNVRSMVELGDMLAHPRVGRVLLLSVITSSGNGTDSRRTEKAEHVVTEGLRRTMDVSSNPQLLVTHAEDAWTEITRVAQQHNCESLLLGVRGFEEEQNIRNITGVMHQITCDVIFLKANRNWNVREVEDVLVPVAGQSGHDVLRARFLSSLCRRNNRSITYIRVVPEQTSEEEYGEIQRWLRRRSCDETPVQPEIEVVRSDVPGEALVKRAEVNDLVVLGTSRDTGTSLVGDIGRTLGRGSDWATIFINH